ncbi:MAG: oxidoreductase domain protein [Phycisphaerales bacterium]|nr:oxidoreductase domain protein [Phycisphaerales bacterium]
MAHINRRGISRRRFLQSSAAAGALVAFPMVVPARVIGANERLNIAAIGAGGKGEVDINGCSGENIIALCDVDAKNAATMFSRYANVPHYKDFREMLDKEGKHIDAVTVSTPDHTHAPAAVRAMRMGKHVYCQKPLTHTVAEARLMTRVAREEKVATQMGNQGHSDPGLRRNVELIRGGVLGEVREAHVWTDRPIWPQGVGRPAEEPVPATMDWDLWLAAAPVRPYSSAYAPFKWRGFWDFGTGALGDMGCHCTDVVFFALDLPGPKSVAATSDGGTTESPPKSSVIETMFERQSERAAGAAPLAASFRMVWYDGGKKPPADLAKGKTLPGNGVLIVGSKDTLFVPSYWGAGVLLSGTPLESYREIAQTLSRSKEPFDAGHYAEWIAACKGGPAALSNFDYAGPMTEALLLGNIAMRVGQKLEWDAAAMKVTNLPEAQRLISKEYRKGWEL